MHSPWECHLFTYWLAVPSAWHVVNAISIIRKETAVVDWLIPLVRGYKSLALQAHDSPWGVPPF